jgi:hypothetical protein
MHLRARIALAHPVFDPFDLLRIKEIHWWHTNTVSACLSVNIGIE